MHQLKIRTHKAKRVFVSVHLNLHVSLPPKSKNTQTEMRFGLCIFEFACGCDSYKFDDIPKSVSVTLHLNLHV